MPIVKCIMPDWAVGCCKCGTRTTLRNAYVDTDAEPPELAYYCAKCAVIQVMNDGRIDRRPERPANRPAVGLRPIVEVRG